MVPVREGCAPAQTQKAVTAYFSSKPLPPFGFARQHTPHIHKQPIITARRLPFISPHLGSPVVVIGKEYKYIEYSPINQSDSCQYIVNDMILYALGA